MDKMITFSVQGNEITGKLQGNAHLWTFESENEYIRSNFDGGKITKHSISKPATGYEKKKMQVYSIICEEAEIPGF